MTGRALYIAIAVWPFDLAPGKLKTFLPADRVGVWVVSVPRELDGPELGWIKGMSEKVHRFPLEADVLYIASRS